MSDSGGDGNKTILGNDDMELDMSCYVPDNENPVAASVMEDCVGLSEMTFGSMMVDPDDVGNNNCSRFAPARSAARYSILGEPPRLNHSDQCE